MSTNHLLPDEDTPVVINGQVSHQTEAALAALEPRANGTGSVTIAGTVAAGNIISLKFTSTLFSGGSYTVTATALAGDTLTTLADRLAAAVEADSTLSSFGVIAEADPTTAGKVDLIWPGPVSNSIVLSATTNGAETFTITQFTGGSGPIIPLQDHRFTYGGAIIKLVANRRISLSSDVLAALVTSGWSSFQ